MKQNVTKTARDLDERLNKFLSNFFTPPLTVDQVKRHSLPLPDLTIEIATPIYDYSDTVH